MRVQNEGEEKETIFHVYCCKDFTIYWVWLENVTVYLYPNKTSSL